MSRKSDLLLLFLYVVIYFLMMVISPVFIPKDYHPSAFAASLTGLIIALLSYNRTIRPDSFIGALFGWSGLIAALLDKTCPAGFTGFLSLALLPTARTFWVAGAKKMAIVAVILSIPLMVAAFIISFTTS